MSLSAIMNSTTLYIAVIVGLFVLLSNYFLHLY